jgi:hypothetical protein
LCLSTWFSIFRIIASGQLAVTPELAWSSVAEVSRSKYFSPICTQVIHRLFTLVGLAGPDQLPQMIKTF